MNPSKLPLVFSPEYLHVPAESQLGLICACLRMGLFTRKSDDLRQMRAHLLSLSLCPGWPEVLILASW